MAAVRLRRKCSGAQGTLVAAVSGESFGLRTTDRENISPMLCKCLILLHRFWLRATDQHCFAGVNCGITEQRFRIGNGWTLACGSSSNASCRSFANGRVRFSIPTGLQAVVGMIAGRLLNDLGMIPTGLLTFLGIPQESRWLSPLDSAIDFGKYPLTTSKRLCENLNHYGEDRQGHSQSPEIYEGRL
jgi:hypothetical protein